MDEVAIRRLNGTESFIRSSAPTDINVLHFWQWSSSDLLNNALRGKLAEFIVATALGDHLSVRIEWDAYDLETTKGVSVEVKSSSYIQSWSQHEHSRLRFSIRKTATWDYSTNAHSPIYKRQAHVYVFCILHHKEKQTVNPLNLDQWKFYCVPTKLINLEFGDQKTIGLSSISKICPTAVDYAELRRTVESLAGSDT